MTSTRWFVVATVLSAALALTGCSRTSAGTPMPDDSATIHTEPSSERPREIKLDSKDPCDLISQSDWPKFDIEQPGKLSEEPNFKSPNCYYSGVGDVTIVVTEGIDAWTTKNRNVEIEEAEPIEGFPSITMANKADIYACYAAVDVAEGQHLLTTAAPNPNDTTKPEKCDLAYQLAESAMKTLVAS